mmetsp:Transcript_107921/g.311010  ORF Transcript_107921/g.311010 Transcript_107921/m.311010 type:complete len:511 (-) Transcript_107921:22-1554(-)
MPGHVPPRPRDEAVPAATIAPRAFDGHASVSAAWSMSRRMFGSDPWSITQASPAETSPSTGAPAVLGAGPHPCGRQGDIGAPHILGVPRRSGSSLENHSSETVEVWLETKEAVEPNVGAVNSGASFRFGRDVIGEGDYDRGTDDAWDAMLGQREGLADALEAAQCPKELQRPIRRCHCCGSSSKPLALDIPTDLPRSGGLHAFSSWGKALRALRTPHCPACGTVTPCLGTGPLGSACDLVRRLSAGAPLAWRADLLPCSCCRVSIASDAVLCPNCATTSPHGGYVLQPQLQRCARCGGLVASDAGACPSCSSTAYRHPGFLAPSGSNGVLQVPCLCCGRTISPDAQLCLQCGACWPVEDATGALAHVTVAGVEPPSSRPRRFLTVAEATEGDHVRMQFTSAAEVSAWLSPPSVRLAEVQRASGGSTEDACLTSTHDMSAASTASSTYYFGEVAGALLAPPCRCSTSASPTDADEEATASPGFRDEVAAVGSVFGADGAEGDFDPDPMPAG